MTERAEYSNLNRRKEYVDDSKPTNPPISPASTGDTSLTELAGIKAGDDVEVDGKPVSILKITGRDLIKFAEVYGVTMDQMDTLPAPKRAEGQQFVTWCILNRNGYSKTFDDFLDDSNAMQLSMKLAEQMEDEGFLPAGTTAEATLETTPER